MPGPPPTAEPEVFERLCRRLREDTDLRRKWAAEDLAYQGNPAATEPLIAALTDRSDPVRLAAITALGQVGDVRAITPLLGFVRHSEEPLLRFGTMEAVWALESLAGRYPEHAMCFVDAAPFLTKLPGARLKMPVPNSEMENLRRALGLDLPIPAHPAAPAARDLPVAAGLGLPGEDLPRPS